jgi:hypothetical protein
LERRCWALREVSAIVPRYWNCLWRPSSQIKTSSSFAGLKASKPAIPDCRRFLTFCV